MSIQVDGKRQQSGKGEDSVIIQDKNFLAEVKVCS